MRQKIDASYLPFVLVSAGNGAIDAGVSVWPQVNWTSGQSSGLCMHCGCAELISECQLHNDMDVFCFFKKCI